MAAMPIARALGSASFLVFDSPYCKPITPIGRFDVIKPLIESQPYVERFDRWDRREQITHDTASFRDGGLEWGVNLCDLQARWVKVPVDQSPWLTVDKNPAYEGAIVVNRSPRHQSEMFPWREFVDHCGKDIVFIGLASEHRDFCNETGHSVKYVPTKNLLEAAQIIQASRLYAGNQSSCLNIAIGLGKRYVCEPSLTAMDCLYNRDGYYCFDGSFDNYEVEGYTPFSTPNRLGDRDIDFSISPPNQFWIATSPDGTEHKALNYRQVLESANRHERMHGLPLTTPKELTRQMLDRYPMFGASSHVNTQYRMIQGAKDILRRYGNKYV